VDVGRDAFPLLHPDLLALGLVQLLVEPLQPADHLPLAFVEPGVLDRNRDLVGEGGEEAFVVRRIAARLVGDADHPNHLLADLERDAQEGADGRVSRRLSRAAGVVEDVVGDVGTALGDHDAEYAGPDRYQAEALVELRVRGLEPLDRGHVQLIGAVEKADEAEGGGGELEAVAESAVEDRGQLMKLGDLDRDRIQRLQLLAEGGGVGLGHRLQSILSPRSAVSRQSLSPARRGSTGKAGEGVKQRSLTSLYRQPS